jgi:3-oxoacyl-[acyl-carrier-protein] synthase II
MASLVQGAHWIREGLCDIVLAGAAEASLHPLYQAAFAQMGVLARGPLAEAACPFDVRRQGFVMGEGAAVLVLESGAALRRRGGRPLAELRGTALRQSPGDAVRFDSSGENIAGLIRGALPAGERPGYVHAHGTGTRYNDAVEARGLVLALGAGVADAPVSSTKGATGHLLGAAGALGAAFCVLALRDRQLPPTAHLRQPDPACPLDHLPHSRSVANLRSALALAYGFGGQMGAAYFTRPGETN